MIMFILELDIFYNKEGLVNIEKEIFIKVLLFLLLIL